MKIEILKCEVLPVAESFKPFNSLTVFKLDLNIKIDHEAIIGKFDEYRYKPIEQGSALTSTWGWDNISGLPDNYLFFGERKRYVLLNLLEEEKKPNTADINMEFRRLSAEKEEESGDLTDNQIEFLKAQAARLVVERTPSTYTSSRIIYDFETKLAYIEGTSEKKLKNLCRFIIATLKFSQGGDDNQSVSDNAYYPYIEPIDDHLALISTWVKTGNYPPKLSPNGEIQLSDVTSGAAVAYRKTSVETEKPIVQYLRKGYNVTSFSMHYILTEEDESIEHYVTCVIDGSPCFSIKKMKLSKAYTNELKGSDEDAGDIVGYLMGTLTIYMSILELFVVQMMKVFNAGATESSGDVQTGKTEDFSEIENFE